MGLDGQLLLSDAHRSGLLHISSLLAGGRAAGAGEIHVENGVVKKIVACTTLYKPNVALNRSPNKAMPPYQPMNEGLAPMPKLETSEKLPPRKYEIVYFNVVLFTYWHIAAVYGLYLCFTSAKWLTIGFAFLWYVMVSVGVTAGAHRLWCHKSYKANLPLQIILMLFQCMAFQNTVTDWVRDHRMHHRFAETDADPHNSRRGLFFSHIGWLLCKKHPEVRRRGKEIDMSDIYGNSVLRFQKKYAIPLITTLCFALPTIVPVYYWGESLNTAWNITLMRYMLSEHGSFLVNSFAHKFGNKPYDKNIVSSQNLLCSIMTFGEGFHNYHHTYPWDYRAAELGNNLLNGTTWFIDFFALFGWAYDRRSATDGMIKRRIERTGDGTKSDLRTLAATSWSTSN